MTSAIEASRLQDGSAWRDETFSISVPESGGFGWSAAASHRVRDSQEDFTAEVAAEAPLAPDLTITGRLTAALHGRIAPRWQIEGGVAIRLSPELSGSATLRRSATPDGARYSAQAHARWSKDWATIGLGALYSSGSDDAPHLGWAAICEAQIAPESRLTLSYSDAADDEGGRFSRSRTIHARIAQEFETFTLSAGLTFEDRNGPDRVAASLGMTFHREF